MFSFYFRLCCVYLFAGNQGDQTLSIKHAAHHTVRDGIGTGTWIGIRFQIGELLARLLRFQHNGVSSVGGFDFKGRQGNPGTYIEICWDRGYGNPSVTLMRTFDKDETGEHTSKCYEISKRERGKNERGKLIELDEDRQREMATEQERVDTANPDELLLAFQVHSTKC